MTNLRRQIVHASSWTLGGHGVGQVIRLAGNLVMTRLLAPDDFGVMAFAVTIHIALGMLSDIGLMQVVVQSKRGDDRAFLDTVWVVQIARGIFIAVFMLLMAGTLVAVRGIGWLPDTVFSDADTAGIVALLAISALIGGFESTKIYTHRRDLMAKPMVVIELASQVFGLVTMLGAALYSRSVYALAAGAIVSAATRTILSHAFLAGERNRARFDRTIFGEIVRFGIWLTGTSVITFIVTHGDRLMLSTVLPARELGLYSISGLLVGVGAEVVGKLVSSVIFPVLSKKKDLDHQQRFDAYVKLRLPIDAIALVLLGFFVMGAESIVGLLYDDRYAGSAWMIAVVATKLFTLRYVVSSQFYMALGNTSILFWISVLRLVGMLLLFFVGYQTMGPKGAVIGVAFGHLLSLPVTFTAMAKYKLLSWRVEAKGLMFLPAGLLLGYLFTLIAPAN